MEQTVREAFERFNVVGFYADPSAGWAQDVKGWEARYSRRLRAKISASEQGLVTYDGDPTMTAHLLNARKSPRQSGYVLVKPADDQEYSKIDAAWGAMFAYTAGLDAVGKGAAKQTRRRAPRRLY